MRVGNETLRHDLYSDVLFLYLFPVLKNNWECGIFFQKFENIEIGGNIFYDWSLIELRQQNTHLKFLPT